MNLNDLPGNASSASTDYSFSYQYNKLESSPDIPETSRKDVEKQEIRDYASMENFRYAEVDDNDALIIYEKGMFENPIKHLHVYYLCTIFVHFSTFL